MQRNALQRIAMPCAAMPGSWCRAGAKAIARGGRGAPRARRAWLGTMARDCPRSGRKAEPCERACQAAQREAVAKRREGKGGRGSPREREERGGEESDFTTREVAKRETEEEGA